MTRLTGAQGLQTGQTLFLQMELLGVILRLSGAGMVGADGCKPRIQKKRKMFQKIQKMFQKIQKMKKVI